MTVLLFTLRITPAVELACRHMVTVRFATATTVF